MNPGPRRLADSVSNLRDMGGLATASGQVVVHGRLFRSSHFGALTTEDLAAVQALGLRTMVDLRGAGERAAAPSRLSGEGLRQLHLAIEPSALAAMRELGDDDEAALVDVMHGVYRRFVDRHSAVFAALVRQLLSADHYPLVFHCTAGKDRTGFAAAVVLLALGVSHEHIVADFVLSNDLWLSEAAARMHAGAFSARQWTVLSRVRADYLQSAFDAMVQGWGSIDGYLAGAIGVDAAARRQLAANLLVDAAAVKFER